MQNTERQKFEESWKSAFDGAEMTPPDRVWSSIELDLAGQESAAMKKRVVFYQRLAAATVLFALLSGVYAFYPGESEKQLVVKENVVKENVVKEEKSGQQPAASDKTSTPNKESLAKNNSINDKQVASNTSRTPQHKTIFTPQLVTEPATLFKKETLTEAISAQFAPQPAETETIQSTTAEEEKPKEAVVSPLLQTAPQVAATEPEEVVEPKKNSRENNLWLALGAAAGNYSPNTPSATVTQNTQSAFAGPQINSATQTPKAAPKVGSSYSVGLAVGKKIGRLVLQTGVNLNKQQVEYTSNYDARTQANSAKATMADYLSSGYSADYAMSYTNEYTVNSTMEIVSIPVQAGYMIIDRKLGWQVNAGFSPDFFLRNILVDKSGQRERFTQSAGSESPYRSVNWSGLANTEISYRLGTHYRLSIVPGVRYSFNSILKEPTNNGRPVILDVGFRFKYLFE